MSKKTESIEMVELFDGKGVAKIHFIILTEEFKRHDRIYAKLS